MQEEVATFDPFRRANFHQSARAAGVVTRLAVAEAAFVEMQDSDRESGGQESSTWK